MSSQEHTLKNRTAFMIAVGVALVAILSVVGINAVHADPVVDNRSTFNPIGQDVERHGLSYELDTTTWGDFDDASKICNLEASAPAWIAPERVDITVSSGGDEKCEAEVYIDRGKGFKFWGIADGYHVILGSGSVKRFAVRLCSLSEPEIDDIDCDRFLFTPMKVA
jgi:hypothetical protein